MEISVRAPSKEYCWEITIDELRAFEKLFLGSYRPWITIGAERSCEQTTAGQFRLCTVE
jgi:hypothetical protein